MNSEKKLFKLKLDKEDMKFSIAHFTVFDGKTRENVHGHNFTVSFELDFKIRKNGMVQDYASIKKLIRKICDGIDEHFIIPGKNEFLRIKTKGPAVHIQFNKEEMVLPKRDVLVLPIENTTVEDFSAWFMDEMLKERFLKSKKGIEAIHVTIASYKGQSCTSTHRY